MTFGEKIKELYIGKKRFFRILLAAELLLLLFGIAGLFGKDAVYEYSIEETAGEADVYMPGISLPRGTYIVSLHYDTDTHMSNFCTLEDLSPDKGAFLCSGEHLYAKLGETDFQVWALRDREQLALTVEYGGSGSMELFGVTFTQNNALQRMTLFGLLVVLALVNMAVLYVQYDRRFGISRESKNVTFGLGIVILLASLPLMVNNLPSSGDLIYHLQRVEGIKDGLLEGQFPVRIAPEWQQGYGYASSIFYGETLLYLAAAFRLIGFPLVTAYRMFLFVINILHVLIAYYSFRGIFRDKYIGLFCSAVHTLSVYRISKTFVCGSLGETFGMMFLPLLAWGFYRVFAKDVKDKDYWKAWILLTVGFSGIVQSHLLTGELAGLFTILLCLIFIKKVFRPGTFLVLAGTVVATVCLSAWFLVPFADYMLTGDFVIQNVSARTIQSRGLYPAHLFFTYYSQGGNVFFDSAGMAESQPMGVGIALWLPLLLFLAVLFFRKADILDKSTVKLGKVAALFGILSMGMSLSIFPWDKIGSLSSITATLVSSIQFPNRLLTISLVSLTVVAGVMLQGIRKCWQEKGIAFGYLALAGLLFVSSIYLSNSLATEQDSFLVYDEEGMGSGYIAGAEYLPYGADANLFLHRDPLAGEEIAVTEYEKNGTHVEMNCVNKGSKAGLVELPLLYYKGYEAWDKETGAVLGLKPGENFSVAVELPAGYAGEVEVAFVSPWYWRAAEVVSAVSLLGFVGSCVLWKKKECGNRAGQKG